MVTLLQMVQKEEQVCQCKLASIRFPLWIPLSTAKKGFVILAIVFFTRVATVYMVFWNDTRIVPCDSQVQWRIQGGSMGSMEPLSHESTADYVASY